MLNLNVSVMKFSRLLAALFVVASLFTFSACEEETIVVKETTGDSQVTNDDAD